MRVVVEVRDAWKRFDQIQAVRGVDLEVPRGCLLGLVGPNGAGKTTLMKLIATLAKPDRGQVRVFGRDVNLPPAAVRSRLGYMPAEFGKLPDMTVAEYLSYFGAAAGVPRGERARRVDDVLELVDLAGRRDTLVSAGSTGIKQRILIAKTLVHDPDLLILDEPAAGLDPRARIEIREILVELKRLGKTIVVSSHILADLELICDEIAIVEHGVLAAHGALSALTDALRRAGERRGWHLRVPRDRLAQARELLLTLPDLAELRAEEEGLAFSTARPDANFVLSELVRAEVPVLSFREQGPRLEDVFMSRTEGTIL